MTRGSIGRRYAKALLELAAEMKKVEEFGDQLQAFADALDKNPQLFDALRNPALSPDRRKAVLLAVIEKMGIDPLMRNFLMVVNDHRRIEHVPGMALSYRELADSQAGRVRAVVTTAAKLKDEQQTKIRDTLSTRIGMTVLVKLQQDPDMIGGVIAQVGNIKFDYSLRNQLRKVREELVS